MFGLKLTLCTCIFNKTGSSTRLTFVILKEINPRSRVRLCKLFMSQLRSFTSFQRRNVSLKISPETHFYLMTDKRETCFTCVGTLYSEISFKHHFVSGRVCFSIRCHFEKKNLSMCMCCVI